MNDPAAGDQPWNQQPPTPQPAAPARPPRQKRQPRAAAEPKAPRKPRAAKPAETLAAPAPKKPRKAKTVERAAPETIKVSLKDFAQMRVGDDAKLFLKLHSLLSTVSKSTRGKVLGEIQKVFA